MKPKIAGVYPANISAKAGLRGGIALCSLIIAAGGITTRAQIAMQAWVQRVDSLDGASIDASAVAVDGSSRVFVTGSAPGTNYYHYITIAYTSAGAGLWTNRYDGTATNNDQSAALAVRGNGNVYVTGTSEAGGNGHFLTMAYSSAGAGLWTNRYDGPANSFGEAAAIAVDGSGDVVVAGSSSVGGSNGFVTIAYSNSGVGLWTNRYFGGAHVSAAADAVAVDTNGNVFVAGTSYYNGETGGRYTTLAYSGAGVPLWTNFYVGPGNVDDELSSMAVDSHGNVIVTGSSYGASRNFDFATIKYSGSGVGLWTNRYDGPPDPSPDGGGGTGPDSAVAVAVDANDNVVVTGNSVINQGGHGNDYLTVKYSSAGLPLWTNRYNGTGNGEDWPSSVAVDGSGNVYVTGQSAGAGSGYDYLTIAYSGAGTPLWTNRFNGPANGDDAPAGRRGLAVAADGSICVTGQSAALYAGNYKVPGITTIKYAVAPTLNIIASDGNFGFTNGVFGFSFSGAPGQTAVVEGTADLLNWVPLQTNLLGPDPVYFADPQPAVPPIRFYRARAQ